MIHYVIKPTVTVEVHHFANWLEAYQLSGSLPRLEAPKSL